MQYSPQNRSQSSRASTRRPAENVSEQERTLSLIGAGALLLSGLRHLSLKRMAVGGYLAYRGATGYCPVKDKLERSGLLEQIQDGVGRNPAFAGPPEDVWQEQPPQDEVEEASMESFPASDPPNYSR